MLRFVAAFEGFRLHRVHKRPVVEHYEGVVSLRRFLVLHAIELTFKLPATFLEIALSLLRCQECQLDFGYLVREGEYLRTHLRRNDIALRGHEFL